jgi:hypothetical protein
MDMPGEGFWIDGVWYEPPEEPMFEPEPTAAVAPDTNERMNQIEAALIELAALIAGGE